MMAIPQEVHDRITEFELLRLIEACGQCECPPGFNCYCASNLDWAERKLEELRKRTR